jgi:hypothetical protein
MLAAIGVTFWAKLRPCRTASTSFPVCRARAPLFSRLVVFKRLGLNEGSLNRLKIADDLPVDLSDQGSEIETVSAGD